MVVIIINFSPAGTGRRIRVTSAQRPRRRQDARAGLKFTSRRSRADIKLIRGSTSDRHALARRRDAMKYYVSLAGPSWSAWHHNHRHSYLAACCCCCSCPCSGDSLAARLACANVVCFAGARKGRHANEFCTAKMVAWLACKGGREEIELTLAFLLRSTANGQTVRVPEPERPPSSGRVFKFLEPPISLSSNPFALLVSFPPPPLARRSALMNGRAVQTNVVRRRQVNVRYSSLEPARITPVQATAGQDLAAQIWPSSARLSRPVSATAREREISAPLAS